jgi:hypothetical protein
MDLAGVTFLVCWIQITKKGDNDKYMDAPGVQVVDALNCRESHKVHFDGMWFKGKRPVCHVVYSVNAENVRVIEKSWIGPGQLSEEEHRDLVNTSKWCYTQLLKWAKKHAPKVEAVQEKAPETVAEDVSDIPA